MTRYHAYAALAKKIGRPIKTKLEKLGFTVDIDQTGIEVFDKEGTLVGELAIEAHYDDDVPSDVPMTIVVFRDMPYAIWVEGNVSGPVKEVFDTVMRG